MGFFTKLMPGSLWRASCPPPYGPLLRNVQIHSRRISPPQESAHRQTTDKTKGPVFRLSLLLNLMPGSSLLSHGETPHYHRRYGVSLLSSAWGQVGPPRYGRQANSFVLCTQFFIASAALPALVKSVTYFCMLLPFLRLPPCCCANYCVLNSESLLKIVSHPPKHLRRCKVKPHGSLVPVSSTHRKFDAQ